MLRKEITQWLIQLFTLIGCDSPDNLVDIVEYIADDVEAAADNVHYHTGDFAIGFRRWMESFGGAK